jgi:hypothetical protein
MLTLEEILRNQRFEEQYGQSERCFSPDKHGEQLPAELPALDASRATTEKKVRLCLESRVLPSGDVVLVPVYGDEDTKNDAGQTQGS